MKKYTLIFAGVFLAVMLLYRLSSAHEGHDDTKSKSTNALVDEIEILKESQFLFDIRTDLSQKVPFRETVKLYGQIIPASTGSANVIIPQSGTVVSVNVAVGQKVVKDQVLAIVAQTLNTIDQVQLLTEKSRVDAEFAESKKEYERLKELEDIVAKKDLVAAEIRYNTAQQAKKVFDDLASPRSDNSGLTYLKSPITGVVDNFILAAGTRVEGGKTLFTVVDLHEVWVETQVFEPNIERISAAVTFTVQSNQGSVRSDKVTLVSVGQTVDPVNQSFNVILKIDNADAQFRPGQFVTVLAGLQSESKEITVPSSAVTEVGGKPVVFTQIGPELFHANYVMLGSNNDRQTVIKKGLDEKQKVVVSGTYQVKSIFLNQ